MSRDRTAAFVAWGGLIAPLAINQARTRADIIASGVSQLDLYRGLVPIVCLVVAVGVGRVRPWPFTKTEGILITYLAVTVASTLWSNMPAASLLKSGSLIVAYCLLLVISRLDERRSKATIRSVSVVIGLVLLASAVGYLIAPGLATGALPDDATPRLHGVFPDIASDFLAFWAVAGILLLVAGVGPLWTKALPVRGLLVAVCTAVLIFTRTRSEIAILLAAGIVLLAQRTSIKPGVFDRLTQAVRSQPRTLGLLIAGSLVAAGIVFLTGGPILRFLARNQNDVGLATLTGRTTVWKVAFAAWWQNPITGLGYYSGHRFGVDLGPGAVEFSNIDNTWLETLVDTGVVGFAPLFLFVAIAAAQVWRLPGQEPEVAARRAILVAGLLASLINPTLQTNGYNMILLGAVLLGAPRPGVAHRQQLINRASDTPGEDDAHPPNPSSLPANSKNSARFT
jgi:O-antigen ligase